MPAWQYYLYSPFHLLLFGGIAAAVIFAVLLLATSSAGRCGREDARARPEEGGWTQA